MASCVIFNADQLMIIPIHSLPIMAQKLYLIHDANLGINNKYIYYENYFNGT